MVLICVLFSAGLLVQGISNIFRHQAGDMMRRKSTCFFWGRIEEDAPTTTIPPTEMDMNLELVGSTPEVISSRIPPFEPYVCLKIKANCDTNGLSGLVVPEELLLPEQLLPDRVTLRVDPYSERTLHIDEVELARDAGPEPLESLEHRKIKKILCAEAAHSRLILECKQKQRTSGGFSGAAFLHDQVPANRWGITLASLNEFVELVRQKWSSWGVLNTGGYCPWKFHDPALGPNMYQVCEQVIRPMTSDPLLIMPGASWALRESLPGTLATHFVSHAWAEGIFEFHRLLEQAWRHRDIDCHSGAYICFLSNPQNLDIGSMLANIQTSPFYVALQHMPKGGEMILIATENAAIHMRLWCVFEAYTAIERDIAIVLAGEQVNLALDRDSVLHQSVWMNKICRMLACFVVVASLAWLVILPSNFDLTLSSCFGAHDCRTVNGDGKHKWTAEREVCEFCVLIPVFCPFFGLLSLWVCGRAHLGWLAQGTFLNVKEAQCSSPIDAERLRAVIKGKEGKINHLVGSLIVFGKVHRQRFSRFKLPGLVFYRCCYQQSSQNVNLYRVDLVDQSIV